MSHPNVALINAFYSAFQKRDAAGMNACYARDVRFRDPVFSLEGWKARAMWRMLCERGKDLRVEFGGVEADDRTGKAHWDAWYTFSASGRKVHNIISASFQFESGRIVSHEDQFSFHRWAGQALGPTGTLLGWAPPFHTAVRRKSAAALEAYISKAQLSEANT